MINIRPKLNAEFSDEYENIYPSEGEVRLIANRNRECNYYYIGIGQCRRQMMKLAGKPDDFNHNFGFLPCKRLVDAHYRCMTEDKYGFTMEEAPLNAKGLNDRFLDCAFQRLHPMNICQKFIDGAVRDIYRGKSELNDSY